MVGVTTEIAGAVTYPSPESAIWKTPAPKSLTEKIALAVLPPVGAVVTEHSYTPGA